MTQTSIELDHCEARHWWPLRIRMRRELEFHTCWRVGEWSLLGCDSDLDMQPKGSVEEYFVSKTCRDFLWRGLTLELFCGESLTYRLNINSDDPRLFVVCNEKDEWVQPFLVTANEGKATSFIGDGEANIFSTSMPEAIQCWIEAFIGFYGEPEVRHKTNSDMFKYKPAQ